LEVNGTPFKVELEQKDKKSISRIQRVAQPSSDSASSTPKPTVTPPTVSKGSNVVNSPLPGVILEIKVKAGDTVKKGDTIMVLEAMKMENNIQSTSDGTVARVSVEKGASVLEGTELIVIE
jgi:biotin carboxyl carrier protein